MHKRGEKSCYSIDFFVICVYNVGVSLYVCKNISVWRRTIFVRSADPMKKILSIILCLSMLVSSVAFAAPVNMAPIDVESVVEQQMTLAGTENDVYTLSFASAGTDVILPDSLDVKQGDVVDLSKLKHQRETDMLSLAGRLLLIQRKQ